MAKSNKFYVVWRGYQTGIFETWDTCQKQITGFEGAQYKAFPNREQAEFAFKKSYWEFIKPKQENNLKTSQKINYHSISVDAACSGNPGMMEYRGVDTQSKELLFHQGPFHDGTNNIGEFLALVYGIAYLTKSNQDKMIYSDSATAITWVRNKKAKTKLEPTELNAPIFKLIDKAEKYLQNTSHSIEIRKWETEIWGEIPADFGRK